MKTLFLSIICLLLAGSVAQAETTGWLSGTDAYRTWKNAKGPDMTLMAIQCRDSGKKTLKIRDLEFRLTMKTGGQRYRYLWAVGSDFKPTQRKALKEGYRQVSLSSFRRKSGLLVQCGVWHKK
ncbi:hypothetical protein [Oricola indica]|jgi:hypothetical protein|uniref:hypothetical protein n=1 Tax=Oricola indica TaxID=2872591 RepID=UPI001CBCF955|nr:hypothetical protein [Oricola indica]